MTATAAPQAVLKDQRSEFEVDDSVAYFNTAAMSPLLHSVRQAAEAALARRARPWTITERHWFEDVDVLRSRAAELLAVSADDIALVPASSYGLSAVARNLEAQPGQRVLVLDTEFPSNHYTWRRFTQRTGAELFIVERDAGQSWTDAVLGALDERVAIASLPNVHWNNGALVDLERVAPAVRAAGASLVIDASQSLGVMPIDVASLRPAAVVAVGYKWLLGPYSLGYMYVDPALHEGEPLEENWIIRVGSDNFGGLSDYQEAYRPGAQRFDVGERTNFQLTPMAAEALARIVEWTPERIGATLRQRTDMIASAAEGLGLGVEPRESRGPHIVGVQTSPDRLHHVAAALAAWNVVASVRGRHIRIAPHLHNNDADVERLIAALSSAV